jgi:putative acetyltransferase
MVQQTEVAVRQELPHDAVEIRAVTVAAFSASPFGYHGEAGLIERLRSACSNVLSLVAEHEQHVVGHALFSPVVIQASTSSGSGMGLGPVAVLPECQGRGIGSLLITKGLEVLRERDTTFVCVFGHPGFYPRFGFQSAALFGIDSEFGGASDGTFQILWLKDRPAPYHQALVRYRREFSSLERLPDQ